MTSNINTIEQPRSMTYILLKNNNKTNALLDTVYSYFILNMFVHKFIKIKCRYLHTFQI